MAHEREAQNRGGRRDSRCADLRAELLAPLRPDTGPDASPGCLIIGEVAQAHDGSLGTAHAFIDAIADAGADAVKFQTHIADAESTLDEPWRVRFSPQDETRFAYWHRMGFSEPQWQGLKEHADARGLLFLSSAFSPEAVDLLERLGMAAWKVASGEALNPPLLARMIATGKPMLVSTGMSTLDEIDTLVEQLRAGHVPFALLQCTTAYPCPPERIGIDLIDAFRQRYDCPAGLSDHSGTIYPGLAAASLGSQVLEVHVAFHRAMFGPDVVASVTVEELAQLVEGVRFIERMRGATVDKTRLGDELETLRRTFGKRVVAARDLAAGTVLAEADLALKKPGDGLSPDRLSSLLGTRLVRDLTRNEPLSDEDVSDDGQASP